MGLMQLMPAAWSDMRARLRLGDDPYDPRDNILAGAFFLRGVFDRFGYPGLFAAYNAGPTRYRAHLVGLALPGETRAYLAKVTRGDTAASRVSGEPAPALFAVVHDPPDVASLRLATRNGLFALRRDMPIEMPGSDLAETRP